MRVFDPIAPRRCVVSFPDRGMALIEWPCSKCYHRRGRRWVRHESLGGAAMLRCRVIDELVRYPGPPVCPSFLPSSPTEGDLPDPHVAGVLFDPRRFDEVS